MTAGDGQFRVKFDGSILNATVRERLLFGAVIDESTGCWTWQRGTTHYGYASYGATEGRQTAHRMAYAEFIGPIPDDMTVDHLCFNTLCINPHHLQLLPNEDNARNQRSVLRSTCKKGHPHGPLNSRLEASGSRRCLICERASRALARERKRQSEASDADGEAA